MSSPSSWVLGSGAAPFPPASTLGFHPVAEAQTRCSQQVFGLLVPSAVVSSRQSHAGFPSSCGANWRWQQGNALLLPPALSGALSSSAMQCVDFAPSREFLRGDLISVPWDYDPAWQPASQS